jgi:hypothetical protein
MLALVTSVPFDQVPPQPPTFLSWTEVLTTLVVVAVLVFAVWLASVLSGVRIAGRAAAVVAVVLWAAIIAARMLGVP